MFGTCALEESEKRYVRLTCDKSWYIVEVKLVKKANITSITLCTQINHSLTTCKPSRSQKSSAELSSLF